MKIQSFKKLKDNKYKVILDNNEEIILYDDVIVKYNLLVNKDLDTNKLTEIKKYNNKMDAYYISLKSLNKKMYTKKELYKILKKYEFEDTTINEVIEKLYSENYLNDKRYIEAYINDQVNLKDLGPNKIKSNLIDLGFEVESINEYLDTIDNSLWINKVNKYIAKKLKSTTNLSAYKLKQKILMDLVNKGFNKELVSTIIEEYEFKIDEDLIIKEYNKIKKKLELKYQDNQLKYQIKYKLLSKGFTSEEIDVVLKGE